VTPRPIALGFLLAVCGQALPAEKTMMVYALEDCGTWLQNRKYHGIPEELSKTWILGFVSGFTVGSTKSFSPNGAESLYAFVDQHCKEKPLDNLVNAAQALMKQLEK
jgi:hypothetical protein